MSRIKETKGKLKWSLFPFKEAEAVVRVFEYGSKKYRKPFTYRKGIDEYQLVDAAIRHLVKIMNGEEIDSESGESHWAHIAANSLMALSKRNSN